MTGVTMEQRVYLEPAFILHKQAFRNSSLLIDFFCLGYGRVRAVARGARGGKSRYRALLQAFQPLLVSFSGKGDVKTVVTVESNSIESDLTGERLLSGLYLNELITRILITNVEHRTLFQHYQEALDGLRSEADLAKVLRRFELGMLEELGYGINLEHDCSSHELIKADCYYLFTPDLGFESVSNEAAAARTSNNVYLGQHILELKALTNSSKESRNAAKLILRTALHNHLGNKPIHSRELFQHKH